MILCILNSTTKVVENKIVIDSIDSFVPYDEGIEIAPQHDGEIGWIWNGTGWDIPVDLEKLAEIVRLERDNLLSSYVDKLNGPRWDSIDQEQKDIWMQYRQDLLDVPQQEGFPTNVVWPTRPTL
jgi:hypothetical protein